MTRVARALAAVVFAPLVLLVGTARRVTGIDGVGAVRHRGRWWSRAPLAERNVGRAWRERPAGASGSAGRLRFVALCALVALGTSTCVTDLRRTFDSGGDLLVGAGSGPSAVARLEAEPWFPASLDATGQSLTGSPFTQYAGVEMTDVATDVLVSVDGVRRSWAPPAATEPAATEPAATEPAATGPACRTFVVWAFGGSALYGLNQRDDRTIPSELARAAWRDGIRLEVVNLAVPGDTAWIENERLRRALAERPAPDLVVFYDGANEVRGAMWPYGSGFDVARRFNSIFDRDWLPAVSRLRPGSADDGRLVVAAPDVDVREIDADAVAAAALAQFGAAHRTRTEVLDDAGIPFVAFVQPWLATRSPLRAGDAPTTSEERRIAETFRRELPPGVVDLTDALDAEEDGLYTDDVHTLEAANPPIAARMWPALRRAVGARPGSCAH